MPDGNQMGWSRPDQSTVETPLLGLYQRLPPRNIAAEQALLGGILADNRAHEKVEQFLLPEHFCDPIHGRIFTSIKRRIEAGKLADPITLIAEYKDAGILDDVGGSDYFGKLIEAMVSPIVVGEYGRVIKDAWTRRRLISAGEDLVNQAFDPEEIPAETAGLFASTVDRIASDGTEKKAAPIGDAVQRAIARSKVAFENGGFIGVRTGFREYDRLLGGLAPGDFSVIGARPGMGKTSFALGIANGVATIENRPSVFFSIEMSAEQLALRNVAMETGVPGEALRTGSWMSKKSPVEWTRLIGEASIKLGNIPLLIDDTGAATVEAMQTQARAIKRKYGKIGVIIVDYLQIIKLPRGIRLQNANERISHISGSLKGMAKELDCHVIALSQLSRSCEQREDKRPLLSDLRDSGSIEQDADVVTFIYREAYYKAKQKPKHDGSDPAYQAALQQWQSELDAIADKAELLIDKNRHGSTGSIDQGWDGARTKFHDIEDRTHG